MKTMLPLLMLSVLQEAESLDARVEAVRSAIWSRNDDPNTAPANHWYPVDIYQDHAIVRQGNGLLRVPYTVSDDGAIAFADAVPVEVEFRPIQESVAASATLVESADPDMRGLDWDVVIIRPGHSDNGFYYPRATLQEAVERQLFEQIDVYHFIDDGRGHKGNPLEKHPRFLAGWIDSVGLAADGSIVGRLHFLRESGVDVVRRQILDAWDRGNRGLFGLSIDARGPARPPAVIEGKSARLVESIVRALSVDIVLYPAAGGEFTRLVASTTDAASMEGSMLKKRLLKLLEARRPEVFAGVDQNTITIEELETLIGPEALQEAFQESATVPASQAPAQTPAPDAVLQATRQIESRMLLRERLQESRLPDVVQRRIRDRLQDQVLTESQIDDAIQAERDYLAQLAPARVTGLGGGRGEEVRVGVSKLDRLQAAFDRACGLEPENAELRTIRPIGLRQLYQEITFGHDPEVNGILSEAALSEMLQEAFTNATLPRVVANTLHRRMVRDYNEVDYGERRIISVTSAADFKTREAVRVGYFGDLATVDPEAADYAELPAYGEESATYAVGQRGNIVTITRKHIINDDIGHVAKVVGRLGRAARRTFARFVWGFVVTNPAIYNGGVWFRVANNNLLTAALSIASLNSAEALLFNQTELSSGEKLALQPRLLAVPIELKPLAYRINQTDRDLGNANNDANPWYQAFGANNENIIVSPFFTDNNDWAVFADPADGDIIEVAFLNGQETPELWLADSPTVGQMFVADKIQYKIRHEYGGAVVDFRTAVKSVVA